VAVASAGPYASLHLAPDRQPCQHPTTHFLQAGCPSCHPTNSIKALKARTEGNKVKMIKLIFQYWAAVSAGLSFVVLLAIEKPFMCISGHFE